MVTNRQVRKLMTLLNQEATLSTAAAKAGMDERTARKYRRLGKLPSEVRRLQTGRHGRIRSRRCGTRYGPSWRQRRGCRPRRCLRTCNAGSRVAFRTVSSARCSDASSAGARWRGARRRCSSSSGMSRAPWGNRIHLHDHPGDPDPGPAVRSPAVPLCVAVFELGVGTVCFTESFESLSAGLQTALWKLGGARTRIGRIA